MAFKIGDMVKWDGYEEGDLNHGTILSALAIGGYERTYWVVENQAWREPHPELVEEGDLSFYDPYVERQRKADEQAAMRQWYAERKAAGAVFHSTSDIIGLKMPAFIEEL